MVILPIIAYRLTEQITTAFGQVQPTTLKCNHRGYTFLTEGRASKPLSPFPWGIRVISNPDFPSDPAHGGIGTLTQKIPHKDFTGACKPTKDGLLFK
jgi:hypothetical protein